MSNLERLERLRKIEGMNFHEIIEFRLINKLDWIEVVGAVYPDSSQWARDRFGRPIYTGPRFNPEEGPRREQRRKRKTTRQIREQINAARNGDELPSPAPAPDAPARDDQPGDRESTGENRGVEEVWEDCGVLNRGRPEGDGDAVQPIPADREGPGESVLEAESEAARKRLLADLRMEP